VLLHPAIDQLSPLHPRQQTLAGIPRRAPSCHNRTRALQQSRGGPTAAPQPFVRAAFGAGLLVVVRASHVPCQEGRNTRIFTPNSGSAWESHSK
jgi:hypothetical protein